MPNSKGCPRCGSYDREEIEPGLFRCQAPGSRCTLHYEDWPNRLAGESSLAASTANRFHRGDMDRRGED